MTFRKALYIFAASFLGMPVVLGGTGFALQATSLTQAYQAPTLPKPSGAALEAGNGEAAPICEHEPVHDSDCDDADR